MKSDSASRRRGAPAGPSLAREIGGMFLSQLRGALVQRASIAKQPASAVTPNEEPPVVAQLMIEIRSDGSRTIARGALNDLRNGESAQVHAEGRTPAELMMSLASSLLALPSALFSAVRAPSELAARESPGKEPTVSTTPAHESDPTAER